MRADGFAVWLVPRPAGEVVPAGAHAVDVFADRYAGGAFPVSTVVAGWKVRRLIALIDSLQIEQPGTAYACPAIGPFTRLLDLRFLAAPGTSPLARAVENGCRGLTFTIRGHTEPALSEQLDLTETLWKLGALPRCRATQRSASATSPARCRRSSSPCRGCGRSG